MPSDAMIAYYCNEMNVRKRQVICDVSKSNITTQAGAMQWTVGDVNATTGIKGVGDLFGKALRGSVTGESAIKPEYTGSGILVLEPTYKHILLVNVADWCSLVTRYSDFYTGVFDFSNVVFYASFTVFVVFLTIQVIEKRRWS